MGSESLVTSNRPRWFVLALVLVSVFSSTGSDSTRVFSSVLDAVDSSVAHTSEIKDYCVETSADRLNLRETARVDPQVECVILKVAVESSEREGLRVRGGTGGKRVLAEWNFWL